MEEDSVSEEGSVQESSSSYNLRSFCNKYCTGEGLHYSPSSSRAGTPVSDLDRSMYTSINGERRVSHKRRGQHHHHHHHHGPSTPPVPQSTSTPSSTTLVCGLGTLEEEGYLQSDAASLQSAKTESVHSARTASVPKADSARSINTESTRTTSVLSTQKDSGVSTLSGAESVRSTRSTAESVRSTRSTAESVRSTRSTAESVRSTRSTAESVRSTRSTAESVRSTRSTAESVLSTRSRTESNSSEKTLNADVLSNSTGIESPRQTTLEKVKCNLMSMFTSEKSSTKSVSPLGSPTPEYYDWEMSKKEDSTSCNVAASFISSPKTGYTYIHTAAYRDDVPPDASIPPPNMTRPSLRVRFPDRFSPSEHRYNLRSRSVTPQPQTPSFAVPKSTSPWSQRNGLSVRGNSVPNDVSFSKFSTRTLEFSDIEEDEIDFPKLNGGHHSEAVQQSYSSKVTTWVLSVLTVLSTFLWSRSQSQETISTSRSNEYQTTSVFSTKLRKLLVDTAAVAWLFVTGMPNYASKSFSRLKSGLLSVAVFIYRAFSWLYLQETWTLVQAATVREWLWRNRRWWLLLLLPLLLLLLGYASGESKGVPYARNVEMITLQEAITNKVKDTGKFFQGTGEAFMSYLYGSNEKKISKPPDGGGWRYLWTPVNYIHECLSWFSYEEEDAYNEYINTRQHGEDGHQQNLELYSSLLDLIKKQESDNTVFRQRLSDLESQLKAVLESRGPETLQTKLEQLEEQQGEWMEIVQTLKAKIVGQDERNAEIKQQLQQVAMMNEAMKRQEAVLSSLGARIESHEGKEDEIREQMEQLKNQTLGLHELLKNCCSDKLIAFNSLQDKMNEIWAKLLEQNEKFISKIEVQQSIDGMMESLKRDIIRGMDENVVGAVERNMELMSMRLKDEVEGEITTALKEKVNRMVKEKEMATIVGGIGNKENGSSIISTDHINMLIKRALAKYDADKTGMTDYALESSGGTVVSTRCTEAYTHTSATYYLFGIPLWSPYVTARAVIQAGVKPGECWAFKGSQGFLVLHLVATIKPTAFSMEHVSKALAPGNTIKSAPRNFSVYGLKFESDPEGMELGNYEYKEDGEPLQYFAVEREDPGMFSLIEIKILSNWGNLEYTCLYRFRVHGQPL